jgi:tetratricopeptide (TPR) repeat protein
MAQDNASAEAEAGANEASTPELGLCRAPRWRVQLFGPLSLFMPDGRSLALPGARGRALLALLAVPPRRAWSREQISQMLWPESDNSDSLRQELARLSRTIKASGFESPLRVDNVVVALVPDRIEVDLNPHHGAFLEGLDVPNAEPFEAWMRSLRLPSGAPAEALPGLATPLVLLPPAGDTSTTSPVLPAHDLLRAGLAQNASLELLNGPKPVGLGLSLELRGWPGGTLSLHLMSGPRQLWAERAEVPTNAGMQALMAPIGRWLAAIDAMVEEYEHGAARRGHTSDILSDRMLFWRADALFREWGEAPMIEAISLLELLVARRPDLARGWALLGFCHASAHASGWTGSGNALRARHYADEAMRRGYNDPYVLGYVAGTELIGFRNVSLADRLATRALEMQPQSTAALVWRGWAAVAQGQFDVAEARFGAALALSPRSRARGFTLAALGLCQLARGAAVEARLLLEESSRLVPNYPIGLAGLAATAHLTGEPERARAAMLKLDAMGALSHVRGLFVHPDHLALLDAVASAAGLMPTRATPTMAG